MTKAVANRLARLRRRFREKRLDALLVANPGDVGYLSGFTGEDSWLLVACRSAALLTDGRFIEQAGRECRGVTVVERKAGLADALADVLHPRRALFRLGFDAHQTTVTVRRRLARRLSGVRLVETRGWVADQRMVKDAGERRAVRRAIRVTEQAFHAFRKAVRLGMTERRLAAELDHRMRLAGADQPAFPTICAVDAASSMPHARPGGAKLKRGSVLLVDFGARVGGYVADLTRVLVAGRISPRVREVYQVVLAAQEAAIARVGPGVALAEVDQAARSVVMAAGFGPAFQHGTGHGIGREVHEPPALSARARGRLEPGMIVTVEPGIYLKGRFGIRIEDDVHVTASGRRTLSRLDRTLEAMVL